jgi:hypothetical protein
MGKVRLFVRVRKQGCRIESVPLKRLLELSGFRKRHWEFKDGWLVLEGWYRERVVEDGYADDCAKC